MKFNIILFLALLLLGGCTQPEKITGRQLIEKSISYHDPENEWRGFQGKLRILLVYPDGSERISNIYMDRKNDVFSIEEIKAGDTITRYLSPDSSYVRLNGNPASDSSIIKKLSLTNKRTQLLKDYYGYLYGLPMKLLDKGTIIEDEVEKVRFLGEKYLKIKVSYREEVGSDTWYFYLDPETYALNLYQFYHDEEENDGEYILLDGEIGNGKLKIPKDRTWYTNDSSKLLGVDRLLEVK